MTDCVADVPPQLPQPDTALGHAKSRTVLTKLSLAGRTILRWHEVVAFLPFRFSPSIHSPLSDNHQLLASVIIVITVYNALQLPSPTITKPPTKPHICSLTT